MKYAVIIGIALAGILLFLLASASSNTSLFAQHYPVILGLKFLALVVFVCLVNWIVQTIAGSSGVAGMETITVFPQPAAASPSQPDVRF